MGKVVSWIRIFGQIKADIGLTISPNCHCFTVVKYFPAVQSILVTAHVPVIYR